MGNPLDPIRIALDKALGPFTRRQKLIQELREPDVGKEHRAKLVEESAQLEAEWVEALVGLWNAMGQCSVVRAKLSL